VQVGLQREARGSVPDETLLKPSGAPGIAFIYFCIWRLTHYGSLCEFFFHRQPTNFFGIGEISGQQAARCLFESGVGHELQITSERESAKPA
jgi:hypothetical protein